MTYASNLAQNGAGYRIVINMSFGSTFNDPVEANACRNAWDAGILLVASAGNDSSAVAHFPCGYPNVIDVAATDRTDHRASWSSFQTRVDLSAPGVSILSTYPPHSYMMLDGTSMSSPVTAGAAALLWSTSFFRDSTNYAIRNQLLNTSDFIDSLNPGYEGEIGYGRVNVYNAMAATTDPALYVSDVIGQTEIGNGDGYYGPGESVQLEVPLGNRDGWAEATNVQLTLVTRSHNVDIVTGTVSYGTMSPGVTFQLSSEPFVLRMRDGITAHRDTFYLQVTATTPSGTYHWATPYLFEMLTGVPKIVLVDRAEITTFRTNYIEPALSNLRVAWEVIDTLVPIEAAALAGRDLVIVITGSRGATAMTSAETDALQAFVNGGGKLVVSGQYADSCFTPDVLASLFGIRMDVGFPANRHQIGQAGDIFGSHGSIVDTLRISGTPGANDQRAPKQLGIVASDAHGSFAATGGAAGTFTWVHRDDVGGAHGKTAYLGFGLEAVNAAGGAFLPLTEVLNRILQWSGVPNAVGPLPRALLPTPDHWATTRAYPNPTTGVTTIEVVGPNGGGRPSGDIAIIDVTGRTLRTLKTAHFAGDSPVGGHVWTFPWDGRDAHDQPVSSGVYFYRLTDSHVAPGRLVLSR